MILMFLDAMWAEVRNEDEKNRKDRDWTTTHSLARVHCRKSQAGREACRIFEEGQEVGFETERQEGMRKALSRKRKGIVTIRREPKWKRNWRAGLKGFKRQMKTFLAAAGFILLIVETARILGGG